MVIKDEFLAITLTYKSKLEKFKPKTQLTKLYKMGVFGILKACGDFTMYPEMTLNGRIHLHGVIKLEHPIYYYKTGLPLLKSYGHVLVKKIDDMKKWLDYCTKEEEYAEKLFGYRVINNINYKTLDNRQLPIDFITYDQFKQEYEKHTVEHDEEKKEEKKEEQDGYIDYEDISYDE